VTIDVTSSPTEVRSGETAQFTAVASNSGPGTHDQMEVGLLALRAGSQKAVPNDYLSITTTQGSCTTDPVEPPFNYRSVSCQLGDVPAGGSVQIVTTVRINESMDQLSSILAGATSGIFHSDSARVRAIYPPRVSGSNKIKLKGLPDGCVDRDFKLTASSKGAKKITASLAGPYDEWHDRLQGSGFSGKIGAEKGSKLKLDVPLERERAGFYDLKLAAKFENKPKQKTEVNIQRCGDYFG
jgi:hypothetical protein